MNKNIQKALRFYVGENLNMTATKMLKKLNEKGFKFASDMTLGEIFDLVYRQYLKEKK